MSKLSRILGWALVSPAMLLLLPAEAEAQSDADRQAVEEAVLDYVEGVYLVQPERIERSVHKDLRKLGYWRQDSSVDYQLAPMTYQQLYDLAARWNADGHVDAETAPKEIVVFDVLDKTAAAKLTAAWGVDYFQLGKYDGKWMIVNVLWQSVD
jgi:hypothetical protein